MDKCHGDQCQDDTKILNPVVESFVQVKVGDQRPKNGNHSLPHDGDVHEPAAHQTLYQKKDDTDIAKYTTHEMTLVVRLGEQLKICIPVNLSTAHRKYMDQAHGFLLILKFFLADGPAKVINLIRINEGCIYYWSYWAGWLISRGAFTDNGL